MFLNGFEKILIRIL